MKTYFNIEKCLTDAIRSVDNVTPTSWPNMELAKYPDSLWLAVHNMRSQSEPVTLGSIGEDNHPGFIQIDFNTPVGTGTGAILSKADEFTNFFTAGKLLSYNAQHVRISSVSLSPGRQVGGWFRVSLTIYYYSRSTR